jgi:hypothetical protein
MLRIIMSRRRSEELTRHNTHTPGSKNFLSKARHARMIHISASKNQQGGEARQYHRRFGQRMHRGL